MNSKLKRIATDIAGYGLILIGIALSPVPGPGGIPLILAGLGLLSINNKWARDLRDYMLKNGGKVVEVLFPNRPAIQWLYDGLVGIMLIGVTILCIRHAATWQISLAIILFFLALVVAGLNRDRAKRLKQHLKRR